MCTRSLLLSTLLFLSVAFFRKFAALAQHLMQKLFWVVVQA